eukprot:1998624-Pleurochrysis_carterae.AAC.1
MAGSEALAAVSCCVVQRWELQVMQQREKGDKVIRGTQGRREGKVDKPRDWAGRDRYSEDGCVDQG